LRDEGQIQAADRRDSRLTVERATSSSYSADAQICTQIGPGPAVFRPDQVHHPWRDLCMDPRQDV